MKISKILLVTCMLLATVTIAEDTVNEPVTQTTFNKTYGTDVELSLYGVAPRIKNILGVYGAKVYGVGLYADTEAINAALGDREATPIRLAAAMMASSGRRALVLKFVRDLEKKVMADAFKEGIEKTLSIDDPRIAADAKKLLAAFTDIKNGDTAILYFIGGQVTLKGNETDLVTIDNRTLARAIMATFLGPNPVDESLKSKLLAGL